MDDPSEEPLLSPPKEECDVESRWSTKVVDKSSVHTKRTEECKVGNREPEDVERITRKVSDESERREVYTPPEEPTFVHESLSDKSKRPSQSIPWKMALVAPVKILPSRG